MTENLNPGYVWKDVEGKNLAMMTMTAQHIQYAHTHACAQEFKYHQLSGFFSDKRDELEEVALLRGIELAFPDEKHPSPKWGNYFGKLRELCNERKIKVVTPVLKKPLLDEYKGLEQVNVFD